MAEADGTITDAAITWDEEQSRRWLSQLDRREAPLVPVLDALFERAALVDGEHVLDVGCGAGPSTREAARRVAPHGRVTGVDISPAMIAAARERSAGTEIDWLVADVATHTFDAARFDVVISRFGVMFFADPLRAFRHLHTATKNGGRLVVAVWPERARSDYFLRPITVLRSTFARLGRTPTLPPPDQGPFALGDPDRVTALLTAAGWTDIDIVADERLLYLSGPDGSDEQGADDVLTLGPMRTALADEPDEVVRAVRDDLVRAFGEWRDPRGVGLAGGVLLVSARC